MADVDLAVVGAGPAGAAAALGALHHSPHLRVVMIDRADFPRDKSCGDGVAPHVLDLLAEVGVTGLLADRVPVARLRLTRGTRTVERDMHRPAYVVPRRLLDARLVAAARERGAELVRDRVRHLEPGDDTTPACLDTGLRAATVVGADGAHSVVRRALGLEPGRQALALRGYAPTPATRRGVQAIVFGTVRQPAYAWSFDRGDGLSNVGYGELLHDNRPAPTRTALLERLEDLLPGAADDGTDWVGHHLPLSSPRWDPPAGRVVVAGDAAGLVNPMTGEGIYYAIATGLAAGRAAAEAIHDRAPHTTGERYARHTKPLLARHLRHTALAARLCASGPVLDAGLDASARDQRVFDGLVELGLARGTITPRLATGLATSLVAGLVTSRLPHRAGSVADVPRPARTQET